MSRVRRFAGADAFDGRLAPRAVIDETLEAKQDYWRLRLAYDPFGRYGATPHPKQAAVHRFLMDPEARVVVIRAGKRAGKSTAAVAEGAYALEMGRRVWVASATLELCKAIFNPLWRLGVESGHLRVTHKDRAKMRVDFGGGGFLKAVSWGESLDNIEAEPADLVLIDEGQKLVADAFDFLEARTVDSRGRIVIVGSEQESSAEFDDFCEQAGEFEADGLPARRGWRFAKWATWDNPHIPPDALDDIRDRLSDAKFKALYGAERRPNHTLVFPEFDRNLHVRELEFLEAEPVTLWVDPGHNWYSVLAVQFREESWVGETIRVFDEVYLSATTTDKVIRECMSMGWWPRVREIVIDEAGAQHTANSQKSAVEEWRDTTKIDPRHQRVSILDGIERTHTALRDPKHGRPRILFAPRCVNTIDEFRAGYKYRKPRDSERPVSDRPIDRANHSCKAIAYGLMDRYGLTGFESYERVAEQNALRSRLTSRRGTFWDRARAALDGPRW